MAINKEYIPIDNQPTIKPRTVTGIFTKYIAKTLPLAFDESMSYYECLCALLEYLNDTIVPDINNTNDGLSELQTFYLQLQDYVNNSFDNLDVQDEINNKLDQMVEDGTIDELLAQIVNVNEKVFYYVEDYGAKGDGETDDSTAINNAFLEAKDKKGTVTFKTQNTYRIDSPIYIPQGCSLYGNGCTILSSVNDYAIYVNSNREDTNIESVGRSFSILRHFNLESTNEEFIENYNGIHFACHGIVQYINFYKIDKCVRFSRPLYIDKFKIEFCNASTRTSSTNYAFDLGNIGDAHEINNVQHTATGSDANSQPNFIYVGNYILNSKMSNIVGNGLIDIRGECEVSNVMLTYYGKIIVQTNHKNITLSNVYASIDYIKNGRIHSKGNYILNLNNCRFISNYVQSDEIDNNGLPITYETTDHIYINQCTIGSRTSTASSNYSTLSYEEIYGQDLINPNIKNKNPNFNIPFLTFGGNVSVPGNLNGTFTYTERIIFDITRLIGKSSPRTHEYTPNNSGVLIVNNSKDVPIYIERQAINNEKVSAYLYPTNSTLYDNGSDISSIPWTSDLLDVTLLNTKFSKLIYNDINVIAYLDDNFSAPNGTWTKNDIIIANDGIKRFDGTNWIAM